MSLDKAIESGKEHRKKYRGAKAVDSSCRNHGADPWDASNRMYSSIKRKLEAQYSDEDWFDEDDLVAEETESMVDEAHRLVNEELGIEKGDYE